MPILLGACSPEETPPRVVEPRTSDAPAPRGAALLERAMLVMHNSTRASARVPELRWSARLAADAAAYAHELARSGRFEHSPQPRGFPNQGENLWTGTRDAYRYDEMAQHWIDERRFFVNGRVPAVSTTGRFEDVGHYVQILWSRTTEFGCGFASNRRDDYLVCRYLPAGNVVGQMPLP